jgi:hypothetical protein
LVVDLAAEAMIPPYGKSALALQMSMEVWAVQQLMM